MLSAIPIGFAILLCNLNIDKGTGMKGQSQIFKDILSKPEKKQL